jgi:hypothetical protein
VRIGSRLVVSGGSRAEDVSSVGPELGVLWAHTAGVTWSREFDWATLRLRGAWGEGIRPPEPGMNRDAATPLLEQVANSALEPERQRGFEAGVDLFLPRGSALSLTWYDQRATDLIQQVQLRDGNPDELTYQFQNVGVVRNSGFELEASHRIGRVTGTSIVHIPRSEVLRVAPGYAGELLPGDGLIEVPEAAGSASLRYDGRRLSVEAGVTWLGEWTGYDWFLIGRVEQNAEPARPTTRGYWLRYPGVARPYVALDIALGAGFRGTVRVDNPANVAGLVRDNISPALGRHVLIGLSAGR